MKITLPKVFLISALSTFWGLSLSAQSIYRTLRRLPDTGQTQSFTSTPGEDADYLQFPPFFIINGDGTVTDTITGLMWQQSDGGEMTFENALAYADSLSLGAYNNWRLPTALEAFSILNQGLVNPALDAAVFPNTGAEYWWTGERDLINTNKIWVTNRGGGIGNHLKTETLSAGGSKKIHVRAVRDIGAPILLPTRFTDNGDGTITDHLSDLIWQKTPATDSLPWEQALLYAENLVLGGHTNWRLPNIKELKSLSDTKHANPSIDPLFFPQIGIKKYWSGSSLQNQPGQSWYLDTRFGITTYAAKTGKLNLLCVRGPAMQTTATAEVAGDKFCPQIFPNPFSNFIRVQNLDENTFFRMLNLQGQVVFEGNDLGKTNFANLPDGIYLLIPVEKHIPAIRLIKI
jgi:hypothetical protein